MVLYPGTILQPQIYDMIPTFERCAGTDEAGPQPRCARQASLPLMTHTNPDTLQRFMNPDAGISQLLLSVHPVAVPEPVLWSVPIPCPHLPVSPVLPAPCKKPKPQSSPGARP